MNITITPTMLKGVITPPPSKSQAHRFILAAALANGKSVIKNINLSKDMQATLRCIENFGASWHFENNTLTIQGWSGLIKRLDWDELPLFDCGESGSTMRFIIPIALAVLGGGRFTGSGRLMQRPQGPYFKIFQEKNIKYEYKDNILYVCGDLKAGEYVLPGNISSQFFTGLLYALPIIPGKSKIISSTTLQSIDYVELTRSVLQKSGIITTENSSCDVFSCGNASYVPLKESVESDWSQAAFWFVASFLGNRIDVNGMHNNSLQGDKVIISLLNNMKKDKYLEIDVSNCPDLLPPLAVAATFRKPGCITVFSGAERLRIKESDRLQSVQLGLNTMGALVKEFPNALKVTAVPDLKGNCLVDAANDHRIAMMAAIAATRSQKCITIVGAECVAKSYPNFWEQYENLGGKISRKEA